MAASDACQIVRSDVQQQALDANGLSAANAGHFDYACAEWNIRQGVPAKNCNLDSNLLGSSVRANGNEGDDVLLNAGLPSPYHLRPRSWPHWVCRDAADGLCIRLSGM